MNRSLFALPLVVVLAACGGAVTDEPMGDGTTGRDRAASTCALAPGGDVCGGFPELSLQTRATLAEATAVAGETRALVNALDTTCRQLLEELGVEKLVLGEDTSAVMRARTSCDRAFRAITTLKPPHVWARSGPSCRPTAPPPCAEEAWWGMSCDPPQLMANVTRTDDVVRQHHAEVLLRRAPIFFASGALRSLEYRAKKVASKMNAVGPGACSTPLRTLLTTATEELETSVAITDEALHRLSL